jgi:hypothetical protein
MFSGGIEVYLIREVVEVEVESVSRVGWASRLRFQIGVGQPSIPVVSISLICRNDWRWKIIESFLWTVYVKNADAAAATIVFGDFDLRLPTFTPKTKCINFVFAIETDD